MCVFDTRPASTSATKAGAIFRPHAPIEHTLRQHHHVGRETMPADVGGLPDASADQFPQAGIGRQAVARAAEIPLAVGAYEVVWFLDARATSLEGVGSAEIEGEHVLVADALEAEQTGPQRLRTASSGPCRSRGDARTADAPRAPAPRSLPPGRATTGLSATPGRCRRGPSPATPAHTPAAARHRPAAPYRASAHRRPGRDRNSSDGRSSVRW